MESLSPYRLARYLDALRAALSGDETDVCAALSGLDESELSRLRNATYSISELAEAQRKRLRRIRGLA